MSVQADTVLLVMPPEMKELAIRQTRRGRQRRYRRAWNSQSVLGVTAKKQEAFARFARTDAALGGANRVAKFFPPDFRIVRTVQHARQFAFDL
jgi:hypothetical protein